MLVATPILPFFPSPLFFPVFLLCFIIFMLTLKINLQAIVDFAREAEFVFPEDAVFLWLAKELFEDALPGVLVSSVWIHISETTAAGWEALWDDDTLSVYFHSVADGTTTWKHPAIDDLRSVFFSLKTALEVKCRTQYSQKVYELALTLGFRFPSDAVFLWIPIRMLDSQDDAHGTNWKDIFFCLKRNLIAPDHRLNSEVSAY